MSVPPYLGWRHADRKIYEEVADAAMA